MCVLHIQEEVERKRRNPRLFFSPSYLSTSARGDFDVEKTWKITEPFKDTYTHTQFVLHFLLTTRHSRETSVALQNSLASPYSNRRNHVDQTSIMMISKRWEICWMMNAWISSSFLRAHTRTHTTRGTCKKRWSLHKKEKEENKCFKFTHITVSFFILFVPPPSLSQTSWCNSLRTLKRKVQPPPPTHMDT